MFHLLFQKGARVKEQDMFISPAFSIAANNGDVGIAQYFVAKAAEISNKGELGRTALHEAVTSGSVRIVKYLIQVGDDVSAKSSCCRLS
jgi:ankyrin repeat protein